jgi:phosphoribosylglycinamide formyltransferase 1
MRNLVVLVSGTGSLLQALIDDAARGKVFQISCVISDNSNCAALQRARAAGIEAIDIPTLNITKDQWQQTLRDTVLAKQPDLVVSAGFMRIIKSDLFEVVPTINAHPSLLPLFPGANAVADALAAGVEKTGASIHYVDYGVDSGKLISQREVPILAGDSIAVLHERIKQVERDQLVEVVVRLCQQSDLWAGIANG